MYKLMIQNGAIKQKYNVSYTFNFKIKQHIKKGQNEIGEFYCNYIFWYNISKILSLNIEYKKYW